MLPDLALPIATGGVPQLSSSSVHSSAVGFRWRLRRGDDRRMTKYQAIRVLANPNVCTIQGFSRTSPNKGSSSKEVIMVDPLEAKRLAAKQMERVQAKEKLKKQRRIEAINGAWAMIGLTAGLVIEGHTGKNIVAQLSGYWDAFIGFFFR
ncbi:uncharacterized protein LOC127248579 isoform X1 [Andrographis paniculata]|uniref:uncharacterized protein LOC127248579 isoform X1 n=1 Tax=Andrographis paniculata TaxID=175694 RepID=UPI0021E9342A|nr:uncharacterized protein LOC127248579 isoform X1 [Andrographis paniculata]XP_051126948.1 uncharacterized protein LOC127248579 isoform X1 [Andrographis paniculata]XP_051126949.1 uncharacterized protein LOC127248579 isoform X1 [Andrographis paniculata]XP_051126950.1 uncharacterized protein LOC127248579 isoform X1 [Andrographis paniculata]